MTGAELPAGVVRTSGATWDPGSPNLVFLAGTLDNIVQARNPYSLIAVNEVETPGDREKVMRVADSGSRILLDSGVFSLAMAHARRHRVSHDAALNMPPEEVDGFDRLWDRYLELATTLAEHLWGVIELDLGGREHKPRTRARIVAESGLQPIPVYHPFGDGWDYYDQIAAGHDRICFANLVKAPPPTRLRLMWTASERARQYPHLWTHLLGVTPSATYLGMPLRGSCDSSSWLVALRWATASWKAWACLHRLNAASYLEGLRYLYGVDVGHPAGHWREVDLLCAQARFQQLTVDALHDDTHTRHPYRSPGPC